jgi:uncharacterized membrane protein YphA (DoxX/SURF4 family)
MFKFRSTSKNDVSAILVVFSSVFLRFALGFSFLSAVGDRFGFWGSFGEHHVAWGTFARFVSYTGQLNWFLPKGTITTLAIVSTCAETILGFLLLLGWQTRTAALLSGVLLLLFAITMAGALGIKAPLDFSVFSASGGAFLLASCTEFPFSIDRLQRASKLAGRETIPASVRDLTDTECLELQLIEIRLDKVGTLDLLASDLYVGALQVFDSDAHPRRVQRYQLRHPAGGGRVSVAERRAAGCCRPFVSFVILWQRRYGDPWEWRFAFPKGS